MNLTNLTVGWAKERSDVPTKTMLKKWWARFALPTLLLFFSIAHAETVPQSYPSDPHIQMVTYDANQVYRVMGMAGYTTAIEFSNDESILSVNIGDSSAWLVNVQNNIVNLKPVASNPDTNMNVVTSRGTYQFFLTATALPHNRKPTARTIFLLRFRYPESHNITASNSSTSFCNKRYSARGDNTIAPINVYDDGRFTYFNFGGRKDIPAVFLVDPSGNESVINYHLQGNYVVVETTGKQFTLRKGTQVASIFNEATSS
jgi:type IV secretion system protein VirB9